MNANELADYLDEYAGNNGYSHIDYADSMSEAATMLRQQQAEIEKINVEWVQAAMALGKAVQEIHEQQAEIEALKKSINEALASIPAYGEQGFYFEHHDINGEYLGHSSIHAEDVVQRIEAILIKAQEK